jgi:hypothetical protein
MPKVIIEFNLPEEKEDFSMAIKAGGAFSFLHKVENFVFRPARKNGYSESKLQGLIDILNELVENHAGANHPEDEYGHKLNATGLIGLLEDRYYELKKEEEIEF